MLRQHDDDDASDRLSANTIHCLQSHTTDVVQTYRSEQVRHRVPAYGATRRPVDTLPNYALTPLYLTAYSVISKYVKKKRLLY